MMVWKVIKLKPKNVCEQISFEEKPGNIKIMLLFFKMGYKRWR